MIESSSYLRDVSLSVDVKASVSENSSPRSVFDMSKNQIPSPRPAKKENKWSEKIRGIMNKLKSPSVVSESSQQKPNTRSASSENLLSPHQLSSPRVSLEFSGESAITSMISTSSELSCELSFLDVEREVDNIVHLLTEGSPEEKLNAVSSVRRLTRNSYDARSLLGDAGVIEPLLFLLTSSTSNDSTLESTALALCNLSIKNKRNKLRMVEAGIVQKLIHLLINESLKVREASVAVLLTLAAEAELKEVIGKSGVIKNIVDLLLLGSTQGKSDSVHTLYNLIGFEPNIQMIIEANPFIALLDIIQSNPASRLSERSVALLCAFSASENARNAIVDSGAVEILIKEIEIGSEKSKEVSVSALHLICLNSRKSRHVAVESGAVSVLLELSQNSNQKTSLRSKSLLKILEKPGSAPMVLVSSQTSSETGGNNLVREMVKESMREAMHQLRRRARILE